MTFEWHNKDALKELLRTIKLFGKPSVISMAEGGIAIWTEEDLKKKKIFGRAICFREIIIRDESIEHLCPKKHRDFIYSTVRVRVKPEQIKMLSSISGSVSYDPLKNIVSARCGTVAANISTLKVVTDLLLDNDVSYKEKKIEYKGLEDVHITGAYGAMIMAGSDTVFLRKIYGELCDNVTNLSNEEELNHGFWKGAFSYAMKENKCLPPDKPSRAKSGHRKV